MSAVVAAPSCQLLLFKQRKTPSALVAALRNMLSAHERPDNIVIGEITPAAADLSGFAERVCVKVAENLVGKLRGQSRQKVDLELFVDFARDRGKLGKAALGDDALEHQLAVLGGSGGEEGPDMRDGLLVGGGEAIQFLKAGQNGCTKVVCHVCRCLHVG